MSEAPNAAVAAIERWLDGPGSDFARRSPMRRAGLAAEWTIELDVPAWPIRSVTLRLPTDFPDHPCELFVDKGYFLTVPHIEEDGRVCLGIRASPGDRENPIGAIRNAIERFRSELLEPAASGDWRDSQFHKERASYWAQFCSMQKKRGGRRPVAGSTLVDIRHLSTCSEGKMVAYVFSNEGIKEPRLQVASFGDSSPQHLASRHGWARGTEVHGQTLFVPLPDGELWTPKTWPKEFLELDALVTRATESKICLPDWVAKVGGFHVPRPKEHDRSKRNARQFGKPPKLHRPVVVFIGVGSTIFGYQLFSSQIANSETLLIEPVEVERIDADWALARDQQLATLQRRRAKRILLLGTGSLGSPLAAAIARAGIGHLDVVDKEIFNTENVSRHFLGMRARKRWKADELAAQLQADVPGITINAYHNDVLAWCRKHCQPGQYDLIIECTAESTVRSFMAHRRVELFGEAPIIHAWLEPLCSAGHVMLTRTEVPWPPEDPADTLVNASDLSAADTRISLPGCADGFHPYGVADVTLVAAFAAERVLSVVDDPQQASTVWSWVRSSGFYDGLGVEIRRRSIIPSSTSPADSATVTRYLADILRSDD